MADNFESRIFEMSHGSKVFETEYESKEEKNNITIFILKNTNKNEYIKLEYFIDYLLMLGEYPIGHKFMFLSKGYRKDYITIELYMGKLQNDESIAYPIKYLYYDDSTDGYDGDTIFSRGSLLVDIINKKMYKDGNISIYNYPLNLFFDNLYKNTE